MTTDTKTIRLSAKTWERLSKLRLVVRYHAGKDNVSFGDTLTAALWSAENRLGQRLINDWRPTDIDSGGGKGSRTVAVPVATWDKIGALGRKASLELGTELTMSDVVARILTASDQGQVTYHVENDGVVPAYLDAPGDAATPE